MDLFRNPIQEKQNIEHFNSASLIICSMIVISLVEKYFSRTIHIPLDYYYWKA